MIRAILALAAALFFSAAGGQAQAELVWHFPHKGTPYAVNEAPRVRFTAAKPSITRKAHARAAKKSNVAVWPAANRRYARTTAGRASSKTVWLHPYKGLPYAVHRPSRRTLGVIAKASKPSMKHAKVARATKAHFARSYDAPRRQSRLAAQSQGKVVWHHPHKGAPYATHVASF